MNWQDSSETAAASLSAPKTYAGLRKVKTTSAARDSRCCGRQDLHRVVLTPRCRCLSNRLEFHVRRNRIGVVAWHCSITGTRNLCSCFVSRLRIRDRSHARERTLAANEIRFTLNLGPVTTTYEKRRPCSFGATPAHADSNRSSTYWMVAGVVLAFV